MTGFMAILTQDILVTCILMGLIAVVGLVGNALMIRALIVYRKLRTDFYTVFVSLSVADSLFLIISVPAHIMDMVQATQLCTVQWCKASHYLMNTCGFIAAYLLVVLSVLRGILLTNRNTTTRPQAWHLLIVSVILGFVAFVSSIPVVNMFTSFDGYCDFAGGTDLKRETWLVSSFSAFVPIFLVSVIYFMTYMFGKRYFSDSYSPREKEKSRLVSSIIIAFIICQMPYRIFVIHEAYVQSPSMDVLELQKMYTIKNYLMCIVMADKAVRPVLYSKLASDLSDAFDEVINCTYCSRQYLSPLYDHPMPVAATSIPVTDTVITDVSVGLSDCPPTREGGRTPSSSSSASATSQTPLLRRPEESIEMNMDTIEVL